MVITKISRYFDHNCGLYKGLLDAESRYNPHLKLRSLRKYDPSSCQGEEDRSKKKKIVDRFRIRVKIWVRGSFWVG